jgi:putative transposase
MCRVLEVSRSGYYAWMHRQPSKRTCENEQLKMEVREIFYNNRKRYGSRRITDTLRDRGKRYNTKRVGKLLKTLGLYAKATRRFKRARPKTSWHDGITDLVNREFTASQMNHVWTSDITYLWTKEGWMYLAVVLDVCSRKIVGYALSRRMSGEIVARALQRALFHRTVTDATIFHSDRGSQFGSDDVKEMIAANTMRQSMGATGSCYDNAITETFFHTLKVEAIHGERFDTREELERSIFDYIECFYNTRRKHSALGYLSPEQFEQQLLKQTVA